MDDMQTLDDEATVAQMMRQYLDEDAIAGNGVGSAGHDVGAPDPHAIAGHDVGAPDPYAIAGNGSAGHDVGAPDPYAIAGNSDDSAGHEVGASNQFSLSLHRARDGVLQGWTSWAPINYPDRSEFRIPAVDYKAPEGPGTPAMDKLVYVGLARKAAAEKATAETTAATHGHNQVSKPGGSDSEKAALVDNDHGNASETKGRLHEKEGEGKEGESEGGKTSEASEDERVGGDEDVDDGDEGSDDDDEDNDADDEAIDADEEDIEAVIRRVNARLAMSGKFYSMSTIHKPAAKSTKSAKAGIKKDSNTDSDSATSSRVIKAPRAARDKVNLTGLYAVYDPATHVAEDIEVVHPPANGIISMKSVTHYPLFMSALPPSEDPPEFCRLDDLTVGHLLMTRKPKDLQTWPVEFDKKGMVRATRNPLGRPYKVWVKAGDVDATGYEANDQDEGYYYGWWKGLHILFGHEGYTANKSVYMIRPSYETPLSPGMSWKKGWKAATQVASDMASSLGQAAAPEEDSKEEGASKADAKAGSSKAKAGSSKAGRGTKASGAKSNPRKREASEGDDVVITGSSKAGAKKAKRAPPPTDRKTRNRK